MYDPTRRYHLGATVLVLALCCCLPVAAQDTSSDGQTTIRKQVDEVNLTFTVTDGRGRFITGLTQRNFAILDNRQPPASVHRFQSLTELPLRICVAFDASDSITHKMKYQQEVAIAFLRRLLRPGVDRACLVKFTNSPEMVQGFTDDINKLETSVKKVTASGMTAVWDALHFTSDAMVSEENAGPVRRVIILITDGDDNASHITMDQSLQAMLRSEIALEIVDSMGDNTLFLMLKKLASATGGSAWSGERPKDLAKAMAKIEASLRSQYFVAYRPSGELSRGEFRKIQMKAVGHKGRLAYRTGYFVP